MKWTRLLVGEEFWRGVLSLDYLAEEGVIAPEDIRLVSCAETALEIWERLRG